MGGQCCARLCVSTGSEWESEALPLVIDEWGHEISLALWSSWSGDVFPWPICMMTKLQVVCDGLNQVFQAQIAGRRGVTVKFG